MKPHVGLGVSVKPGVSVKKACAKPAVSAARRKGQAIRIRVLGNPARACRF